MACLTFLHIRIRPRLSPSIAEAACGWMNLSPASRRRYSHDLASAFFLSDSAALTFGAGCGSIGGGAGLFISSAAYVFAPRSLEPDCIPDTVELESQHQRRKDLRQSKCGPSNANFIRHVDARTQHRCLVVTRARLVSHPGKKFTFQHQPDLFCLQ